MIHLRHLFMTDVRRFRWLMLLWLALVVAGALGDAAWVRTAGGAGASAAVALATTLIWLAATALSVALVPLIVQTHPGVGSDAFWMTRPIRPLTVVASKALLLIAVLVGGPVAVELVVMTAYGIPPGDMALVTLHNSLIRGAVLVTLLTVAALTPSLSRFVVACVLILLAVSMVTSLGAMIVLTLRDSAATMAALSIAGDLPERWQDPSRSIMGALVLIAAGLMTVALQYRRRSLVRSLACAGIGLAAAFIAATAWPWSTFGRQMATPEWARDPAALRLVSDAAGVRYTTAGNEWRGVLPLPARIGTTPVRLQGVPRDRLVSARLVGASVDVGDGSTVASGATRISVVLSADTNEHARRVMFRDLLDVRRVAIGLSTLHPPIVFVATESELESHAGRRGFYRGDFQMMLTKMDVAATLPLARGAAFQDGAYRVVVDAAEWAERAVRVSVRVSSVRTILDARPRPTYEFLLRHTARGEAIAGTLGFAAEHMFVPGLGPFSFGVEPIGFSTLRASLVFALWHPFEEIGMVTDPAWLEGAELVILRSQHEGVVRRTLEIPDFPLPNPAAVTKHPEAP